MRIKLPAFSYMSDLFWQCVLPIKVLLGAFFGFLIGLLILFFDYSNIDPEFLERSETRFWLFLLCLQFTFSGATFFPLIEFLRNLRRNFKLSYAFIFLSGIIWFIFYIPLVTFASQGFFKYQCQYPFGATWFKSVTIGVFVAVSSAIGGCCILYIEGALRKICENPDEFSVSQYRYLKEKLFRILLFLCSNLTLFTLIIAAKLNVMRTIPTCASQPAVKEPFVILFYGVFYSALLALTYLPTYLHTFDVGHRLSEALLPSKFPKEDEWDIWYERNEKLERALGIKTNLLENAFTIITVLIPVASSVYSLMAGK